MRLVLAIVAIGTAWAHDAPSSVKVHMHARPDGNALRVLARIPLEAVRDVDFPATPEGYLDVVRTAPRLPGLAKLWVADTLELYENGARAAAPRIVATQISLESDRSFATFDEAAEHLRAPPPRNEDRLFWKQVFFDVELAFPIASPQSAFSLRPNYTNLGERVDIVLHLPQRTLLLSGDPGVFPLAPTMWQAASLFTGMGFRHILDGIDHLLFVLCLVIPIRRLRQLVWVVTSFTVAHSVTLAASALNLAPDALWFPPLVEVAIALSIVYLALANIFNAAGHGAWRIAFAFGLVHGFGFSFALRESLQFAGDHLVPALLAFNLGVELGQLLVIALMAPALAWLFRRLPDERLGVIVLSALVAHTGWHWMLERAERLGKYALAMPELTAANGAIALRWLFAALLLSGFFHWSKRWRVGE